MLRELPTTPACAEIANNDFREAASVNIETVRLLIFSRCPLLTLLAAVQEVPQCRPRRGALEEVRTCQRLEH
jgi:hypothetical protein